MTKQERQQKTIRVISTVLKEFEFDQTRFAERHNGQIEWQLDEMLHELAHVAVATGRFDPKDVQKQPEIFWEFPGNVQEMATVALVILVQRLLKKNGMWKGATTSLEESLKYAGLGLSVRRSVPTLVVTRALLRDPELRSLSVDIVNYLELKDID